MKPSLRRRLVVSASAWVLAFAVVGGAVLDYTFRASVTRAFDVALSEQLHELVAAVETAADGSWWLSRRPADPGYQAIYGGAYWQIVDDTGRLERSRSLWDTSFDMVAAPRSGSERHFMLHGPAGQRLRAVERTIAPPRLGRSLTVRVARSRAALDAETGRHTFLLAVSLAVMAAGLLIAIAVQVGFGLRPLRRMASDLRDVREGRREALDDGYPREVQPLVDELGAVLAHNRRLAERARSSAADLAHALKAPLSVMSAELHAPGEDWRSVMSRELDRTRSLVERHLGRAATTGAGRMRRTPVASVANDLVRAMTRLHGARGIAFELEPAAPAVFAGEREDLEEMLGNLADNAGKWARSRVRIGVRAAPDRIEISVDDDGAGLPPSLRERLPQRGRRFDEMMPGSGLGLAIVDEIAASYEGQLSLDESPLGGLRAILSLPAVPADGRR
jgi:signal transduction histidine kinase